MNVIMVPARNRPEFLYISLSSLLKNKEVENYKILFVFECDVKRECQKIVKRLIADVGLDVEFVKWDSFYGLSKGILEGMKIAFTKTDEYVIVLEEDVMVSRDYLRFVDYCYRNFYLKRKDIATISGMISLEHGKKRDVTKVRKRMWYSPYGVLIPKKFFFRYVYPHCIEEYYCNPSYYCDKYHPNWIYRGMYTEQAGLINRIIHKNALYCLEPEVPRCQHIGWYSSKRRLYRLTRPHTVLKAIRYKMLPLNRKIEFTLNILRNVNLIRRYFKNEPAYVLEENHEWSHLELDE